MLDLNKPVQIRDGRKARIICTDRAGNYSIVALVGDIEDIEIFTEKGQIRVGRDNQPGDLINVPEKHVRYLNVYSIGGKLGPFESFRTASEAEKMRGSNCIACKRVEFKEGQFDEYNLSNR